MQRVERNAVGESLRETWTDPATGSLVDPGTVTIGITAADGTVLVAPGTATTGSGAAARTFPLTLAHTALLDNLTVTWTSSVYGSRTPQLVEIVGGFLFSIAEARAWSPLNNATNYPTDRIVAMRTLVEDALEHECEVAFVPRYTLERADVQGGVWYPRWPRITAIRSVTVDGVAVTGSWLTADGGVRLPAYYTAWQTVMVGYEHGYLSTPPRVSNAALAEARYRLIRENSPTDDRAVRQDLPEGSYTLQQPGRAGMRFFIPDVDAAVQAYSMRAGVA